MTDDSLIELLIRWENHREQHNEELSPQELCRERPDLQPELEQAIRHIKKCESRVDRKDSTPTTVPDWALGFEPVPGHALIEKSPFARGGSGELWKAKAPGGKTVVIKRVSLEQSLGKKEKEALDLMREVSNHPHLLSIHQVHVKGLELIIVMEAAEQSLQQLLKVNPNGIPRKDLLRYMEDAAQALDYLNEETDTKSQILHRDIKPGNLLLLGGAVKVADFGLAKSLERTNDPHSGAMTSEHAAPEWFEGRSAPQSDQYSLALTYFKLRTGRHVFDKYLHDSSLLQEAQLHVPPILSPLPETEQLALNKALAKDPSNRWSSCQEFVEALKGVRHREDAEVDEGDEGTKPHRARRKQQRPRTLFMAGSVFGVLTVVLAILSATKAMAPQDRQVLRAIFAGSLGISVLLIVPGLWAGLRTRVISHRKWLIVPFVPAALIGLLGYFALFPLLPGDLKIQIRDSLTHERILMPLDLVYSERNGSQPKAIQGAGGQCIVPNSSPGAILSISCEGYLFDKDKQPFASNGILVLDRDPSSFIRSIYPRTPEQNPEQNLPSDSKIEELEENEKDPQQVVLSCHNTTDQHVDLLLYHYKVKEEPGAITLSPRYTHLYCPPR